MEHSLRGGFSLQRVIPALLLATCLLLPALAEPHPEPPTGLAAIGLGQSVLITWLPSAPEASYNVYGLQEETLLLLGSTSLAAYLAPTGFSAYHVSAVVDGVESQTTDVCVSTYPGPPFVGVGLCKGHFLPAP